MFMNSEIEPTGWKFSCSKKVDDISKHESKHDPKYDPKHGTKPTPENQVRPGSDKNPDGTPLPGTVNK